MVGKTVGKYRFVEKLGRGAMGTVYKAVDDTLDREVAIKILNPELGEIDVMKRFRAEASMLAKLNHPAIATIYELHRADDDLLMVMEFVPGESLDQLVQRGGPQVPGVLSAIEERTGKTTVRVAEPKGSPWAFALAYVDGGMPCVHVLRVGETFIGQISITLVQTTRPAADFALLHAGRSRL
jgi:serine/threonine protein kinase